MFIKFLLLLDNGRIQSPAREPVTGRLFLKKSIAASIANHFYEPLLSDIVLKVEGCPYSFLQESSKCLLSQQINNNT